jgi:hypothetical protein
VPADAFRARFAEVEGDASHVRILRSVLMKPEHEHAVAWLHDQIETFASELIHD